MTITRVNLCTNPAMKVGESPGWRYPAGWARSIALSGTLPRTTGVAGTAVGTVSSGPAYVVPGKSYVGSISMRSIAANTGAVGFLWVDQDGNTLAPGATTAYSQTVNTTARITTPVSVAPAGAVYGRVSVTGIDGSMQLTAALIEQVAATGGAYFDGDDAGAAWVDGAGNSPSKIVGTSDLAFTVDYDEHLGRIRVLSTGGAVGTGRARVTRRSDVSTTYVAVRGGVVPLSSGSMARSADDYEYPAEVQGFVYRVETLPGAADVRSLTTDLLPPTPIDTLEHFYVPPQARAWLKFVANPHLNRRVTIIDWSDIERPSRNSLFEVREREDPVIVTAGHSSRRFDIVLRTFDIEESEALDHSLKQGIPGFLHVPATTPVPGIYCVFGDYKRARPSRRSQGSVFTIPLIEVDAPPASIVGTGNTWQSVLDENATWAALLASAPTWQAIQ